MLLTVVSMTAGFTLAILGLAQTLQQASLIDSAIVRATLLVQLDATEGLFLGATIFLVGILLFASGMAIRSTR